ncbi:MAG: N-6 DNA methylase [Syntrophales bacterium]
MITTEELIRGFSEESFAGWCRGKFADFVPKSERLDEGDFSRARQIGFVRTLADGEVNRPLLVAAVQVPGELGERSSRKRQFDFARKALQRAMDRPPGQAGGLFTQGLFVFYGKNGGDFRMSLISGRVEGGKLAYNSFKRQTFFVRQDQVNRTFRDQMEKGIGDYPALCEAFSIEALTKQFYNELFAWYEWALSDEMDVRFPNDIHTDKDNRELISEHMIRLITRLMFVWFIKQKHLVPDEIFRVEELRKLLRDFDPDSETKGNYYNAILQNLFFATLNNKIEDRDFATNGTTRAENENHYGVKTLFRNPKGGSWFKVPDDKILKLFEKVPFLNGGLFECLDRPEDEKSKRILYYDGFSREEKVKGKLTRAFVPNCLFFDKDDGLIPLFQRYNFTVEENSPNDAEVALDPELLGKVFENLLGAYNPETKETARKQSGSFYTPREIVSYMVDESLKQYLKTQVQIDDAALAQLFEEEAKVELTAAAREKLSDAIKAVNILDPACGSGAFPMGALHRLVDLLVKLDGQTENLYDLKLHLIENCIYGVDIQSIAVQISKLRFFISLVCEQKPNGRKADNYGILPLPNLETKFVVANTLIGLEKKLAGDLNLEDEEIAKLRKELLEIRHRHFLSKSSQEKHTCRRQDKAVREKIQKRIVTIASTPDKGKITHLEESIRKLEGEKSKYRGEKWETILVPKQGDLFGGESGNAAEKKRVDTNRAKREEIEGRIQLCERDIAAEKGKKISKELVAAAEKLAAWNPYDQNESSPFFDPEWMFGVKEGFSIVIGNPPYIDSELMKKNCPEFRDYLREQLNTTQGNWDLYIAFTETAFNLLSQNGFLSFITPNKWLSAPYGKALRGFLRACVTSVVDCSAVDVFEAGNTPIVFIISRSGVKDCKVYRFEKDYVIEHGTTVNTSSLSDDNWGHLLSRNIALNNKIATHTSTVGDLFIVENPFTTGEAYELCDILHEAHDVRRSQIFRFVNTGTIAKYRSLWGVRKTTYLKSHYENPVVPKREFANAMPRRARQSERPKIIIKGIRYFDSFVDPDGSYIAGKSTIIVFHSSDAVLNLHWLSAILNSKLIMFLLRSAFSSLGIDGGINFSKDMVAGIRLPTLKLDDKRELAALAERAAKEDPMADISNIEGKINERVYRLYSLTSDEISIVEGACAAPKKSDNEITSRRPVKTKSKSALVDDEGLD